jgi:hypothetical protein
VTRPAWSPSPATSSSGAGSVFSNIFARPDPLTACSCLAQCARSESDGFRSVFRPAVDFFSHVEALGSCIDSALRFRFQEHATALSSSQLSRQLDLFFCPALRISFLLQELDCGYCFLPTPLIVPHGVNPSRTQLATVLSGCSISSLILASESGSSS